MPIASPTAMGRRRYRDSVPPLPTPDARQLGGLPSSWEQPIAESTVDGLERRAETLALTLAGRGRKREADVLRRQVALLARADELHRHASNVETLAGLYRALAVLAHEPAPAIDDSLVWVQAGALGDETPPSLHGPAFRATAALRNRAYRLVARALARHSRELGTPRRGGDRRGTDLERTTG